MRCQEIVLLWPAAMVLATGVGGPAAGTAAELPQLALPGWARPPAAGVGPVTFEDARSWLRFVIPMPQRVRIEGQLRLAPSDLRFRLRPGASEVEHAAVRRLAEQLRQKAGIKGFEGSFPIVIGVCDAQGRLGGTPVPGAESLDTCPNADQAYLITPLAERGLAVAAKSEPGGCSGATTLGQLLGARAEKDAISVPLGQILDWPDLEERGQWGGSSTRDIAYLAERKMNLIEAHSKFSLDTGGRGVASIDVEAQREARLHGIKWVPIITHLDQLTRTGLFERYPQLKGKGPKAQSSWGRDVFAACFSEPKMSEVLADWFASLASIEGVTDINTWLSESHVQCGCPKCAQANQYVLEATACIRAWQLARQKHPRVRLRILLTQGSYTVNDKLLALAPPEVGVTYYDGGRTYDSSREPMIYPLLENYARQGRWLGCYPQLTASWRIVCPWSGPQFIKFRMSEFVDKRLRCLCGYATPDNRFYDFNVTAAAEWSWNARGRSEEQFALAWATRRGLADPQKAARWAVLLGPVGWDVYGSGIPYPHFFGDSARWIRSKPAFGKNFLRYFPSLAHIERDLAVCDQALGLAQELGDPALLAETRVIRGYVGMVQGLVRIASAIQGQKELAPPEARLAQEAFKQLATSGRQTAEALHQWKQIVASDCTAPRIADTVEVTEKTVASVAKALASMGVQTPGGSKTASSAAP